MTVLAAGLLKPDQMILLVILVIAILFLVMRITSRRRRDTKQHSKEWQHAQRERLSQTNKATVTGRHVRADMDKVSVELHEFAREIEGRLDTKIAYLRGLLNEVEEVGQKLESLLEKAGVPEDKIKELAKLSTNNDTADTATGSADSSTQDFDKGQHIDIHQADPKSTDSDPLKAPGAQASDGNTFERVVELHETGKNAAEIADTMSLPKGEIELMINLHQSKQGEGATG